MLKKLIAGVAVSAAFVAAPAHAFLTGWYLDVDGAGGSAATRISSLLDIVGPSYVQTTTPDLGGNFSFVEVGGVNVVGRDGGLTINGLAGPGAVDVSARFDISGTATLGGTVSYTGGTISVYSNPDGSFATTAGYYGTSGVPGGILIGVFSPITGGGLIDPTGVPNGLQTISAQATFLQPGYFFNTDGVSDLSGLVASGLVFGFATTNASVVRGQEIDPTVLAEIPNGATLTDCLPGQTVLSGAPCTGITGQGSFIISNNGQFRLQVPEPSGVALGGLAFVLAGLFARRRLGSK